MPVKTVDAKELPRIPPVDPEQALATFQLKGGFRMELVAAEPRVMDPIALSFDEKGRMYVVEMRDYSERRDERLGRIRLLEGRLALNEVRIGNRAIACSSPSCCVRAVEPSMSVKRIVRNPGSRPGTWPAGAPLGTVLSMTNPSRFGVPAALKSRKGKPKAIGALSSGESAELLIHPTSRSPLKSFEPFGGTAEPFTTRPTKCRRTLP